MFDAVAGAFEGDDVGVVHDAVVIAEAMVASPKTCRQRENGRLEVRMIEDFSYRVETNWKNRLAASVSKGM